MIICKKADEELASLAKWYWFAINFAFHFITCNLHNIIHVQLHVIHYDIDHVIYQKYFFYIYERIKDNI